MHMNLKPKKHKRISFNTTMTSLGFIGPPPKISLPPKFNFLLRSPQLFWTEIFRSSPKIRGGRAAATMATLYFSKKLIHLLNVTGKILTCQNLNVISSGWNTKFAMQLKSTQYLPLPRFCQLSCKLPSRTRPSIIKLGTNSI